MKDKTHNIEDIFREAFKDFEATPAPEMMENILGVGFDASVQKAFSDFEPELAPHIWEQIGNSIPSESEQAIRAAFEGYEVQPAAGIWAGISGKLENEAVEDNFDAQFQAAFDEFSVTPPAYLMNNVLENDFDNSVRRSLANYEIEPSEDVWRKIRPLIPLSLVVKRHLMMLTRVAAVIVAIMMFSFLVNEYVLDLFKNDEVVNVLPPVTPDKALEQQPTVNTESIPDEALVAHTKTQPVIPVVENQKSVAIDVSISPSSNGGRSSRLNSVGTSLPTLGEIKTTEFVQEAFILPVAKDEAVRESVFALSIPSKTLRSNTAKSLVLTPKVSDISSKELQFSSVSNALDGAGKAFSASTVQSNLIDMEEDADIAKMMLSYKGWYVMSSMSVYNSWILNEGIRDAVTNVSRPDYVVDLGRSFGLGAGYQFTPNFGMEAELVSGRLSQSYRELSDLGVFNTSEARADYFYVPLSFKYQTRRLNSMNKRIPMTASVVMGTHYGQLRNSDLRSNREVSADDAFIKHELGVFMGADYYMYLHPNTYLTLGARGAAGTDVNKLSSADTPYNLQFGVRLGLHYRFASRANKWEHGVY